VNRPAADLLSPDASMSCQAGGNECWRGPNVPVGRPVVTGQFPFPPLFWLLAKLAELWPTEACLPAGQGAGNSRRKSATKERRRDTSCPAGPDEGGARRAGADTYNPTGQQPKRRGQNRARGGGALRSRNWTQQPAAPADALLPGEPCEHAAAPPDLLSFPWLRRPRAPGRWRWR
jgi:hypothetical protein